uniref:Lipocalin/cytosolic fatty-acid binding domain-containing protein n=1 Tax=Electrophorus electricus TaxID=8005 RepID=A0AAY5EMK0_ELEEL
TIMSAMLGFLTVLLWATVAYSDISPMTDFSLDGMKGKWYSIGVASNAKWFTTHKANMKMGTLQVEPTADGDLHVTFTYLHSKGSCWEKSHVAKKTDTSGCFFYHSKRNNNDMCVIDAKFDEFVIIHVTNTEVGHSSTYIKLCGRSPHLSNGVVEKFQKFALDNGIESENILTLPPNGNVSNPFPLNCMKCLFKVKNILFLL